MKLEDGQSATVYCPKTGSQLRVNKVDGTYVLEYGSVKVQLKGEIEVLHGEVSVDSDDE